MGERVLLAGGTEKSRELLQTLAAPGSWECCKLCHSGGETLSLIHISEPTRRS